MTDYMFFLPLSPMAEGLTAVQAEVEFGVMQANGDCIGIGICRIITTHQLQAHRRRRCARAQALLCVSEARRLCIFFPRSGMLPCTERAIFRKPLFALPQPLFLSEAVRRALPQLQQLIVAAGTYPIRASAAGYWIAF